MTVNNKGTRGFKVCKGFEDCGINLPKRATKAAAGYDFESAENVVIPSVLGKVLKAISSDISKGVKPSAIIQNIGNQIEEALKPTLVSTGVKSYMLDDEYLQLASRSSTPMKKMLLMTNGIGVIDADYYGNSSNDGHIMFQFVNFGLSPKLIKKGERIGQGMFLKFLKTDNDDGNKAALRSGGYGSTGE